MAEGRSKLEEENVRDNRQRLWPNVPISVDTAEKFWLQIHVVEAVEKGSVSEVQGRAGGVEDELIDDLVPVGLDFCFCDVLKRFSVTSG